MDEAVWRTRRDFKTPSRWWSHPNVAFDRGFNIEGRRSAYKWVEISVYSILVQLNVSRATYDSFWCFSTGNVKINFPSWRLITVFLFESTYPPSNYNTSLADRRLLRLRGHFFTFLEVQYIVWKYFWSPT